ncbi:hypothetical protein PV721_37785 [Streptomyces sp. MB09-01]|uniref:hypothetical protein n=1 Tax=Streptomyces sp. MB09-01 TaxID=3028666 RepID=UPI0029A05E5B|nr:hypothetical protein [Streptomyces sp. MB09-01]MDX3539970.1 hypothetical protein [Streptomyces sp. MB09-01]
MHVRPATHALTAVALLACALVSGCSQGSAEAKAVQTPPPSAQEVAYYRCLETNGVPLEKRDDGQLRVDKDKNDAAVEAAAEAKCADRLLSPQAPRQAPAEFVAKAKMVSACIRENGYPDYPDPDPVTADVHLNPAQRTAYEATKFQATAAKCSSKS